MERGFSRIKQIDADKLTCARRKNYATGARGVPLANVAEKRRHAFHFQTMLQVNGSSERFANALQARTPSAPVLCRTDVKLIKKSAKIRLIRAFQRPILFFM
jgi:hypothetical protein